MRHALSLVVVSLLAGCAGDSDGIWLLEIAAVEGEDPEQTVEHNFSGAWVAEEEEADEWTEEESSDPSSRLQFVQFVEGRGNTAVLVVDDAVYPGTRDGGVWTFTWTRSSDNEATATHETGYQFTADTLEERQVTYHLDFGRSEVTGDRATRFMEDRTWTESDMWSDEARGNSGQIPAGQFLLVEVQVGEETQVVQAANMRENSDCDASPCSLHVEERRTETAGITGTWYDYADDYAYDGLEDAMQDWGA